MVDEACRVVVRGAQRGGVVEQADQRVGGGGGGQPGEGALAGLPCTVDRDNSGVSQRLHDECLRLASD